MQTLQSASWKVNLLITITVGVRGVIHKQSIQVLKHLKIPPNEIKKLMKQIHQISIKYLTYLVPNKRKLNYKQAPVDPP